MDFADAFHVLRELGQTARLESSGDLGMAVVLLLLLQLSIGVANVWLKLPLWLAVAHNAGAPPLFRERSPC